MEQETFTTVRSAVKSVVVRFAGDSGDGMQLAGTQLALSSALAGNEISTFPDFPAEIRAPKGTPAGVSGFQVHFSAQSALTPGDNVDVLVAMNPAALRANLQYLTPTSAIIVDTDAFDAKGLRLAKYDDNPLKNGELDDFHVLEVPITSQIKLSVAETGVSHKEANRCRNFYAMGLIYWMYGRSLDSTYRYIADKFNGDIAEANRLALRSGWHFGETTEAFERSYQVPAASPESGTYRNINGNEAFSLGLVTAAELSDKTLFYSAYPITPASDILHRLSRYGVSGARTFQAEDEIAAVCASIGAAFGGAMGATGTSGPGIALKSEALGLAVMLELPLVVINVQRGGPSTGLPTKVEQTDLFQAVMGRNGEAPMPVLAASSPADCFQIVLDAWRIATKLMTPVMILSDAFTANGAEPWRIPDIDKLEPILVTHPPASEDGQAFRPYDRNEWLARPWAIPGTKGLTHRIGGIEKEDGTGNISYDPVNHQKMVALRAEKVAKTADLLSGFEFFGPKSGDLLVVSWGGTFGACREAVMQAQKSGESVSHVHLRLLNPLPGGLGQVFSDFKTVMVAELNSGQLRQMLRSEYLVDAKGLNKIQGLPFWIEDVRQAIEAQLLQES